MSAEVLHLDDYRHKTSYTDVVSEQDQLDAAGDFAENVDRFGHLDKINTYGIVDANGYARTRLRAAMYIGASKYAFRITESAPDFGADSGVVIMLPGFTEDPSIGTAKALHHEMANQYPDRDIISICSDGYHKDGSPLSVREIGRTFDEMANARLNLASSLAGDRPVIQNGLSKGSVLTHHMAQQNAQQQLINSEGLVYHSPAIVPPRNISRDMVARFLPHIYADTLREATHHPLAALRALHLPSPALIPAYICDIYNLLHGTPESEVDQLLRRGTSIGVVAGDRDPLAQLAMWQKFQDQYPDKVDLLIKPNQGHGASIDAVEAARDIRAVATGLLGRVAIA